MYSHAFAVTQEDEERLEKLAQFQEAALRHALRFPATRRLVYSTCSGAMSTSLLEALSQLCLPPQAHTSDMSVQLCLAAAAHNNAKPCLEFPGLGVLGPLVVMSRIHYPMKQSWSACGSRDAVHERENEAVVAAVLPAATELGFRLKVLCSLRYVPGRHVCLLSAMYVLLQQACRPGCGVFVPKVLCREGSLWQIVLGFHNTEQALMQNHTPHRTPSLCGPGGGGHCSRAPTSWCVPDHSINLLNHVLNMYKLSKQPPRKPLLCHTQG